MVLNRKASGYLSLTNNSQKWVRFPFVSRATSKEFHAREKFIFMYFELQKLFFV